MSDHVCPINHEINGNSALDLAFTVSQLSISLSEEREMNGGDLMNDVEAAGREEISHCVKVASASAWLKPKSQNLG